MALDHALIVDVCFLVGDISILVCSADGVVHIVVVPVLVVAIVVTSRQPLHDVACRRPATLEVRTTLLNI